MPGKFDNQLKGIYAVICNQNFIRFNAYLMGKGLNIDEMTETAAQLEATSFINAMGNDLHDAVEAYFDAD